MLAENSELHVVKALLALNNAQLAYWVASVVDAPIVNLREYCDASSKGTMPKHISRLLGWRRWWGWWGKSNLNSMSLGLCMATMTRILREYAAEDYRSRSVVCNELVPFLEGIELENRYQSNVFCCMRSLEFLDAVVDFRGYEKVQNNCENLVEIEIRRYVADLFKLGILIEIDREINELKQSVDLFINRRCRNIFTA